MCEESSFAANKVMRNSLVSLKYEASGMLKVLDAPSDC